jgi:hypothetical protein
LSKVKKEVASQAIFVQFMYKSTVGRRILPFKGQKVSGGTFLEPRFKQNRRKSKRAFGALK